MDNAMDDQVNKVTDEVTNKKVIKTEEEWRAQLSPQQYNVTREAGTERPFTGIYHDHKGTGIYRCVCCDSELFDSGTKFDSGCGWPSFYAAKDNKAITMKLDKSHFMRRTEVLCSNCDAHLGHIFPDGPQPTGDRFCINSASLQFVEENENPSES